MIPGVAEELVSSRTYMVNAGLFEDMDIMLSTHISRSMSTSYGISGSGSGVHGVHVLRPVRTWRRLSVGGTQRSGCRRVNEYVGWNFRREHLRLHQRSHYIISNGGNQPNVVPSEASVWYYFRELDYDRIKALHETGQNMAKGASLMTNTTVSERIFGAAWPSNMSKPLAELMHSNIKEVGSPEWTEQDQQLALAVQEMMGQENPQGLPTESF